MMDPGPLQGPSYAPMPTAAPRPGALGLIAGIGSSVLGGVTAGMSAGAMVNKPPTVQPIYVA